MAAAPCHHSKDQPAPTHRGRDRLRRRRQRPSQVRSKTSRARPCEASGALLLSNGGTGGGHAACTLWPPKVGFRLAKAKSLCDLRIRLWRIRSLWRPLGTFPRGESTSSARRRTKPPTKNTFLVEGKGKSLSCFPRIPKDFASAEAPRGLPPSPPEPLSLAKNISSTAWRIRNIKNPRPPRPKAAEARGSILPKDSSFSRQSFTPVMNMASPKLKKRYFSFTASS